jgi:hypothetical protein
MFILYMCKDMYIYRNCGMLLVYFEQYYDRFYGLGEAQVVDHLPGKHKTFSSNHNITKTKQIYEALKTKYQISII